MHIDYRLSDNTLLENTPSDDRSSDDKQLDVRPSDIHCMILHLKCHIKYADETLESIYLHLYKQYWWEL